MNQFMATRFSCLIEFGRSTFLNIPDGRKWQFFLIITGQLQRLASAFCKKFDNT